MLQEQEPLASSSDQDIGGFEVPALRLSPIVENKEPRGAVTGLIGPVHCHTPWIIVRKPRATIFR